MSYIIMFPSTSFQSVVAPSEKEIKRGNGTTDKDPATSGSAIAQLFRVDPGIVRLKAAPPRCRTAGDGEVENWRRELGRKVVAAPSRAIKRHRTLFQPKVLMTFSPNDHLSFAPEYF